MQKNNFLKLSQEVKNLNINTLTFLLLIFPLCVLVGSALINLYFVSCLIFLAVFFFSKKNFIYFNELKINWLNIMLIILIYQCFVGIFTENNFVSLKKALSQFRFFLFIVLLGVLAVKNFNLNLKTFINIKILIIFIVCADGLYQYFTGENSLGFKLDPNNPNRIGGFFDQELIFGSFIFFISIPVISALLKNFQKKILSKKIFIIFFILVCFLSVLLSGERMSFLLFSISLASLFVINFNLRKAIFFTSIILFITLILISFNNSTQKRAKDFYDEISLFKQQNHIRLFSGAINIWKENYLFGVGIKNYRNKCNQNNYDKFTKKNTLCSTHPHNFYLEILAETGLLGLLLYLYFFTLLVKYIIKNFNKMDPELKGLYSGCALIIFTYIWPIKSSGSFFSTFTASFFWYNLGILYYLIKKNKIQ